MKKIIVLIIASLFVIATGCSPANTSKSEPEILDLTIEIVDDSNFNVVTTAEGDQLRYAYYVFKDNEVLEKFAYGKDAHFSYSAKEPGLYKVRSYIKDKDGKIVRKDTKEVEIE
ncbi:triple tyrosine motif-containing protein [Bacillus niameyensis]|uniref:triple tyrosine motif-containing protein n=1 Tax=Bacillus niameyensis TaxID=1522308 RepID=UPI000782A997|nr:triple tyrosine motif-containing protein [Bacillus niameyensis]